MNDHCRHPGCRCESRIEYDGFCSTECASAGAIRPPTGQCTCGHPPCSAAALRHTPIAELARHAEAS